MQFSEAIEKMLSEDKESITAVAIWRTARGFNCFVKGNEFEIVGMAAYLEDLMKTVIAQAQTQRQDQRIVVPQMKVRQ